jgi:hypothetical protein
VQNSTLDAVESEIRPEMPTITVFSLTELSLNGRIRFATETESVIGKAILYMAVLARV